MDSPNWKVYKYKVVSCVMATVDGNVKIESGMIQGMYLEKNYDEDNLPIFLIQIAMGAEMYQKIAKSQDSTLVSLNIESEVEGENGSFSETSTYIKDIFTILTTNATPFLDQKTIDNSKESSSYGEGTVTPSDMAKAYTFILARRKDLDTTKKIVNTVLTSTDIITAVSYAMSASGCNKVLMSRPDNNTKYNELMLLPIPLINQLRYLNNYYGVYKEGAQIFFDFDRTYFIRKTASTCTAYDSTEPLVVGIYVYDHSNSTGFSKGSYTNTKDRIGYITTGPDNFSVEDLSTTSSQYAGNNSLIINNSGKSEKATGGTTDGGRESFNIITTSSHNQFMSNETALRLQELKSVATVTCTNCDLKLITPNRKYQVVASSSSAASALNHPYRLVSCQTVFVKDGNHFTNTTEFILKKTVPVSSSDSKKSGKSSSGSTGSENG